MLVKCDCRVTHLALRQQRFDTRPRLALRGIAEQIHDNSSLLDCLMDVEKIRARDPAILNGLFPRGTILSNPNYDVQAVVAEIQTLAVALGTVTDEGEGVIFEVILQELV